MSHLPLSTFYKVVAKVLANIIKPTLPIIINNSQFAFIKRRDISNNITLAQEICGELNYGIHGNAFCAKLDLKKTFDFVSRSVITTRMAQLGYPALIIDWI